MKVLKKFQPRRFEIRNLKRDGPDLKAIDHTALLAGLLKGKIDNDLRRI